jgi:hypothetical protein
MNILIIKRLNNARINKLLTISMLVIEWFLDSLTVGGYPKVAILKHFTVNQAQNFDRSTKLDLTTEPPLLGRCCYAQAIILRHCNILFFVQLVYLICFDNIFLKLSNYREYQKYIHISHDKDY